EQRAFLEVCWPLVEPGDSPETWATARLPPPGKKLEKRGRVPYLLGSVRDTAKMFGCPCTSARHLSWSSRHSLACWLFLLAATISASRVLPFPPSSRQPRARRSLSMTRTRTG